MNRYLYLALFFLIGCGTGEPVSGWTNHVFQNTTIYDVEVIGYNRNMEAVKFNLKPEESYVWDIPSRDGADNGPFSTALFKPHDSVLVH